MSAIIASPRPGMPAAGPSNAWAERISAIWQQSTAAIIETGRLLIQARDNLDHGQWLKMVQAELPFNQRTAQRLMAIAQHPVLSNTTHVPHLPSSWGTLYELTKLPSVELEAKISDGSINPRLERRDVAALLPNTRKIRFEPEPSPDPDPLGALQRIWDKTPNEIRQQFAAANAAELREMLATTLVQTPALSPPDDYPDLPDFLKRSNPSCGLGNEMTGKDAGCLREANREPFKRYRPTAANAERR
jgi:hypothetical protein